MQHSQTGILTIDLSALAANYRLLAARAPRSQTAAAIKADAYGLGAAQCGPALAQAGCDFFYVAHLDEGIALRRQLPMAEIAVLHGIAPAHASLASQYRLLPVLCDLGALADWRALAQANGAPLPVIIHLDTGINRLGLGAAEASALADDPALFAGLSLRYWMSHLACADEPDNAMNNRQLAALTQSMIRLPPGRVSFANSSGIFLGDSYHFDQVRPGCALYGLNPTPGQPNPMHPVVRLAAPVQQLRPLEAGTPVGYSASWRSKRLGKLAVLPVGYADGFIRALGNRGTVHFSGHAAPIVGRVSMDMITVDVTDVPEALCRPGMLADLIGPRQDADAVAAAAGTIGYEVLTNLGPRYRRVYEGEDGNDKSAGAAGPHLS